MSLRRSRSVALVTALLLLAGGLFSCSAQHDRNEDLQRDMEAIERKIVPLDAQVLARSGPVQSNLSITATWEIETKMDRGECSNGSRLSWCRSSRSLKQTNRNSLFPNRRTAIRIQ